jgi:hypothetical protein
VSDAVEPSAFARLVTEVRNGLPKREGNFLKQVFAIGRVGDISGGETLVR